MFDSESVDRISPELFDGEELLWAGHSSGWPFASAASRQMVMVAIGLVVMLNLGVGAFFMTGNDANASSGFIGMSVIIMVLIAVLAIAMVAFKFARLRQKMTYAITNQRIVIINNAGRVTSYGADDIEHVERRTKDDGSGDIIFRYDRYAQRGYAGNGIVTNSNQKEPVGFFGIDNVREVERLMLETFVAPDGDYGKVKRKHGDDFDEYLETYEDVLADMDVPDVSGETDQHLAE